MAVIFTPSGPKSVQDKPTNPVKDIINKNKPNTIPTVPDKKDKGNGGGKKQVNEGSVYILNKGERVFDSKDYGGQTYGQVKEQEAKTLARANMLAEQNAKQADTNYVIKKDKGFVETVRDVTQRQESKLNEMKLSKSEILSNPFGAIYQGAKKGYEVTGMAFENIGSSLGGVFGYGAIGTKTFQNKNETLSSGGVIKGTGFGIPILALGQTYKQRDIKEQGLKIQESFLTNVNKSQSEFSSKYSNLTNSTSFTGTEQQYNQYLVDFNKLNTTYNSQTNQLTNLNLGSTNSTGSFNLNQPTTTIAKIFADPNSTRTERVSSVVSLIGGKTAEAVSLGYVLEGVDAIGAVTRGTEYLVSGSKAGKAIALGVGSTMVVAPVITSSIEGYKDFTSAGAKGSTGALIGAGKGLGEVSGFVTGATKGEFLFVPGLKYREIGIANELGNKPTKVLSVENPFGKGSQPIVTKSDSGFSFGYPKELTPKTFGLSSDLSTSEYALQASSKTEVGFFSKAIKQGENRLGTEQIIFDKGLDIARGLSNIKIKDVNALEFEKSGVFKNLGDNQKAKDIIKDTFTSLGKEQKGFEGFINAVYDKGLERVYGSSTISSEGGFKTNVMRKNSEFGDYDLNFRDLGIPKAQKLFKELKGAGADVKIRDGLIEIKNPKSNQYEHAFDFHGADTPDLQMSSLKLGIKGAGTKEFSLSTGSIKGQQLRQSLVDKGSATLQLRVNTKGQFYFSPPDYRLKDVSDFVSISQRLNEVKGGNIFGEKIESFKNVLKVAYPEIKFDGGTKLLYGGVSKSSSSLSSATLTSFKSLNSKSNGLTTSSKNSGLGFSSKSFTTSSKSPSGYSLSPSPSKSPNNYSPSSYSPSSKSPSGYSLSPSPSASLSPSPSMSSYSSSFSSTNFGGFELPSLGGYVINKPKKRGKKKGGFDISPSFTAIVKNIKITEPLKISKTFGVTPFQSRGLLVGKKSKGSYFQFTDI